MTATPRAGDPGASGGMAETAEARAERYAAIIFDRWRTIEPGPGRLAPSWDRAGDWWQGNCRKFARAVLAEVEAERAEIEIAARAHVECLARYTTEAYCDDEERALRAALGLPPLSMGETRNGREG